MIRLVVAAGTIKTYVPTSGHAQAIAI